MRSIVWLTSAVLYLMPSQSVAADTYEPNDTHSIATPLASGAPVESYVSTANDVDFYVFSIATTRHVRLDLTIPAGRTYALQLLEQGNLGPRVITQSLSGGVGLPRRIDWTLPPGTYWVRVASDCCASPGYDASHPYTLTLTAPPTGDTFEPNETSESAIALSSGVPRTSYIATTNDVDFYAFSVATTLHVRVDLTIPAGRTYSLQLLEQGHFGPRIITQSLSGGLGLPRRIDWTLPPGTYWVRVASDCCASLGYDATHPYTLTLTAPPTGDAFEPNETSASATPLISGVARASYIATTNDVDFYAFSVGTTQQVRLDLSIPAGRTYSLQLLEPGILGPRIITQSLSGGLGLPRRIEWTLSPGTYWVRVASDCCASPSYDPSQPYTLTLTASGETVPTEPTDESLALIAAPTSQTVGGAITLVATVQGVGAMPLPNEVVHFKTAAGGQLIGSALTSVNGQASLVYRRGAAGTVAVFAKTAHGQSPAVSVTWRPPRESTPARPDPLSNAVGLLEPPPYPIVFIHGIISTWATWAPLIEALDGGESAGLMFGGVPSSPYTTDGLVPGTEPHMYAVSFTDPVIGSGLRAWADELSGYLQRIAEARGAGPAQKFILVAHSAGGLAARHYLQSPEYRSDVAALVTYGTPHAGTPAATALCAVLDVATVQSCDVSQGIQDMRPGSDFLLALDRTFLPRNVSYVSLIGSLADCVSYPEQLGGVVLVTPNDCIVPSRSQDLSLTFAGAPRGVRKWATSYRHMAQTSDVNGILLGLQLAGMRPRRTLTFEVQSPIDIVVTDPLGRRVGKEIVEVPWAAYDEYAGEDGSPHDTVMIPLPLRGEYTVQAVAQPGAGPAETYSIVVHQNGVETVLARNAPVGQIPAAPYSFANLERRYLAEGATGFFATQIALLNPGATATTAQVRFLPGSSPMIEHSVPVPARTRVTLNPKNVPGLETTEFSTVVESDQPLVVDRTMSWDGVGYGSHSETAVAAPSLIWYLAEGATHGGFSLFYLLQNPASTPTTVRVRYLRTAGEPLEKAYLLAPQSRTNIWVNVEDFPGLGAALASAEFSAVVESLDGIPIIVERAMYRSNQSRPFNAGHASMGVTAPSTQWFLAEGATGPYFDMFVLMANPTDTPAQVRLTYLLGDGTIYTRMMVAPANARAGVWVDVEQFPGTEGFPLANVAVSTTVESTNAVPLVVERAMWWPGDSTTWHEAHNSAGATATGTRWAVAEGEVGGSRAHETYLLIANTSSFVGSATVTLLFEDGTSVNRVYALLPNSRTNVAVAGDFGAVVTDRRFGAIIESTGATPAQIVVERAMYSSANGVAWAAGTNALATRLP